MYSVVSLSARVAGARPSSRSDEMNRRSPSISVAVIGPAADLVAACAPAIVGASEAMSANEDKRMGNRIEERKSRAGATVLPRPAGKLAPTPHAVTPWLRLPRHRTMWRQWRAFCLHTWHPLLPERT